MTNRTPKFIGAIVAALTCILSLLPARAASAADPKKSFDIPGGAALPALKQFTAQSDEQLLYSAEVVQGVTTNSVKGTFTAREALDAMISGTNLAVISDKQNGALSLVSAPIPNAQRAARITPSDRPGPSETGDEAIKLSPFTITATEDRGYLATSTLAGSRTKTLLKDVAAQISVFTPELMSDLGLTNLEEVYLYSTNVESYLEFTPGGDRGAGFGTFQLSDNNRIRGFTRGGATNLRGFFPTGFALETYNTERITIASGPNAILFGLGNPGGITDASLKRAGFRNHTSLTYRLDNFDGHRFTLDTNYALLPKKAALRIAGLEADNRTSRAPNKDENRRLYGALTLQPFTQTTIRLHGEWVERIASRAPAILARDYLTPWLDRGRPAFSNANITSASAATAVTNLITTGNLQSVFARNGTAGPVFMAGNTPANQPVAIWANTAAVRGAHTNAPKLQDQGTKWSLLRPEIFDPRANVYGDAYEVRQRGRIFNVFVEQQIAKYFAVEAGYMNERLRKRQGSFIGSETLDVQADANRYLPDGTTLNPNFGKLYVESSPTGDATGVGPSMEDREEWRLTASYELDFTQRAGLTRWLGRHRLAAMYNDSDFTTKGQTVRASISGSPSFLAAAARNNLGNAARLLYVRTYLGNGVDHVSPPFPGGALNFTEPLRLTGPGGEPFEVRMWDNPDGAWGAAGGAVQNVITRVLAGQSYLLKDRLIASYGWSGSHLRTKNALDLASTTRRPHLQTNGTTANLGLFPLLGDTRFAKDWDTFDQGQSINWGLVGRPLPWLSVHYSDSENFAIATAAWFDPFGRPIPGSNGDGKDYGFSVHLADGKLALRVNRFANSQKNTRPDNIVSDLRTVPFNIEDRILEVAPNTPTLGMDRVRFGNANYQVTNTSEARGYDIELTANPTANWRTFVSIGRQRTVTQIDNTWWDWAAQRLPVWQSFGRGWEVETRVEGNPETIREAYERWIATKRDPLIATNGQFVDNQREWRANGILTYAISEGRLRGASIGLGGRWRSAATVGYGLKALPGGQEVLDLDRPFKGAEQFAADAFFSYSLRKVPLFRLRSGWKLQVNVRNLLNDRSLVVTNAKSDGSPRGYATQEPRQIITTLEFQF